MTERNRIEIDYCPSCRGVWLDKGELDKMLEYTAKASSLEHSGWRDYRGRDHDHTPDHKQPGHGKPYKKKSFLGDLFDFD